MTNKNLPLFIYSLYSLFIYLFAFRSSWEFLFHHPIFHSRTAEAQCFSGSDVETDECVTLWLLLLWTEARPPQRKQTIVTKVLASISNR